MREIKFKYKDMCGEWVYKRILGHIYNVDQNTLCQYTGLKDINGKEIYEFDVLKTAFSNEPFGVVRWHDNGYFFIDCSVIPIQWNSSYRPLGEMVGTHIDGKPINIEVIGNIIDNPELFNKIKDKNEGRV